MGQVRLGRERHRLRAGASSPPGEGKAPQSCERVCRTAKFAFAVDPDSPALKKSREQLENLVVVQTVKGINTDRIVDGIGTVPEHDYGEGLVPCGAFSYSSDNKQILLGLQGYGSANKMLFMVF